jgi:hypothetical protein
VIPPGARPAEDGLTAPGTRSERSSKGALS